MKLPEWLQTLPIINASLNGLATVLLLLGYWLIKRDRKDAHRKVMLTAFAVSCVFLVVYLTYHQGLHYYTGTHGKSFQGTGVAKVVYLTILISHVILAAVVPVLAIITIVRGLKEDWERHRRIARITFPIWLYVSITGVIIYAMLYHWPVD
jgi:protein SCO1/2/putative membrane protein